MKILYLITKSEIGGAQTYVFQLAQFMKVQGNEVAVMAFPGGRLEEEIKKIGARFYSNEYFKNSFNPIWGFLAIRKIKKVVQEFQPDLVSCNSTVAGFWGRLAIKNKIPTLFTAHGWGFTPGTSFWRRLVVLAEKLASNFCQKIICVSDFDRKLALKYKIAPKEKLITIHNGVEILNSKLEITNKFQTPNYKFKIVFTGRLDKPKDPELLLRAFAELPENIKEKTQINLIGEGPKKDKLKKLAQEKNIEEKVEFWGELSRMKVIEILKKSDIFVLTSNYEGFPITILEAMSCGLPVIASDVGGVKEAVDESCGIIIKRGDKKALKEALEQLLTNPELIQKLGENALKRVEKNFSLEKMLKETEKVYDELVK